MRQWQAADTGKAAAVAPAAGHVALEGGPDCAPGRVGGAPTFEILGSGNRMSVPMYCHALDLLFRV